MGDGMHIVSEILVCDSFCVALWSVPYAAHFGFAAVFEQAGLPSAVRTPTGHAQPILLAPYRMPLTCAGLEGAVCSGVPWAVRSSPAGSAAGDHGGEAENGGERQRTRA